jgi:hypothetical protein
MSSGYKGNLSNIFSVHNPCMFESIRSELLNDSSLNYNVENTYTNERTTYPYPLNSAITTQALYKSISTGISYDDSLGKCPPKYIFNYIDFDNNLKTAKGNWVIYTTPNRFLIRNIVLFGGAGTNFDIPKNIILIGRNSNTSDWYLITNIEINMSTVVFQYLDNNVTQRKQIVAPINTGSTKYAYKQTCAIFTQLAMGGMLSISYLDYDGVLYM